MKTNKITVVPRLRFPEFQDGGDWRSTILESIAELNPSSESLPDNFIYIDLESVQDSSLLRRKKISIKNAPSRAQRLLSYEDVLFQTVRPYQKNNYFFLINDGHDYVASTGYAQLRAFECSSYLNQYLYNDRFVERVLQHCAGGNYPAINSKNLAKINVEIPSLPEQQKIADCLSSLDDSIDAEIQQLESLKTHKAGLLQNLFPAEDETVPNYRFAEFKDDGDWESFYLTDIADNLDSKRVPITSKDRLKGQIPYYGASGIIDYVQNYIFDDDLLCVSEDGANLIDRVYPIAFSVSGKSWINNHAHVLKFNNMFTQVLVQSYLNSISLGQYLTGVAQPKLNKAKLNSISIPLPRVEEQKKIADCLSSLDNLIESQDNKIEVLKQHKQGLMQQLFPVMDEK